MQNQEEKHPFDHGAEHIEEELKHDHKENDKETDFFGHVIAPAMILVITLIIAIAFILYFSNNNPSGKTNKERINRLLGKTSVNLVAARK